MIVIRNNRDQMMRISLEAGGSFVVEARKVVSTDLLSEENPHLKRLVERGYVSVLSSGDKMSGESSRKHGSATPSVVERESETVVVSPADTSPADTSPAETPVETPVESEPEQELPLPSDEEPEGEETPKRKKRKKGDS